MNQVVSYIIDRSKHPKTYVWVSLIGTVAYNVAAFATTGVFSATDVVSALTIVCAAYTS